MVKYIIYEDCPICTKKLEKILNEKGLVIDFWCNQCGLSFPIEDLKMVKVKEQENIDKWF